jgi:protein gp37
MGSNSTIEWTHATFNPWWGCIKVSPGCEHCYALSLSKRWGYDIWGPAKTTQRRMMSDAYWRQPLKWNKEAEKTGERKRVFCASMADVFEANPQLTESKARLFELIETTPWLDWLLLTKRPENIMGMIPYAWHSEPRMNVWYGTSVENQEQADKRIPELLKVPAKVRFLSCEPLLEAVDLGVWLTDIFDHHWRNRGIAWRDRGRPLIDWVICGGESGQSARPMHPQWARSLRDQCQAAGVAYHFKQWGQHEAVEFADGSFGFQKVGKHAAGRILDGRTWDELPS